MVYSTRLFVVLLRKSNPQNHELQIAVVRGVMKYMNRYRNAFMGVEVYFPDSWNFRYWGNRPDNSVSPKTHQSHYEDLPSEEIPEKVLVTSISGPTTEKIILRGLFEIVALYRPNGVDLQSEIPVIPSEISRSFGSKTIAENHAHFMHRELQCEGYIRYLRCYYWQFQAPIWLACIASGSSLEQFNEALGVVERVRKI